MAKHLVCNEEMRVRFPQGPPRINCIKERSHILVVGLCDRFYLQTKNARQGNAYRAFILPVCRRQFGGNYFQLKKRIQMSWISNIRMQPSPLPRRIRRSSSVRVRRLLSSAFSCINSNIRPDCLASVIGTPFARKSQGTNGQLTNNQPLS